MRFGKYDIKPRAVVDPRVAVPFCHLHFFVKIQPRNYPKEILTLGDHIRARRLDRGLYQREIAPMIGTSMESINHWETNSTQPVVKYYPKLMEFLGYCPIQYASSFGELLLLHRTHRGLSHKNLGKILGFDQASLSRWENGECRPYKKWKDCLMAFFEM